MTRRRKFPSLSPYPFRAATFAGTLLASVLLIPGQAYADPDEDVSLDELNERVEKLEEDYQGELRQYTEAEQAVEEAQEELKEVNERLERAEEQVTRLASTQYRGTGLEPAMQVVLSSDPDDALENATLLSQVSHSNGERVLSLNELRADSKEAAEEADTKLQEAEEMVEDLEEQRDEVEAKIERYEAEQTPAPPEDSDSGGSGGGTGSVPESAVGPGFHDVTPRMAAVRDEIISTFGAPYPVGCRRASNDDHGIGKACDFMMSSGGAMPSEENMALGDRIAEYAKNNADRLGVKYVIWKQRIWDARNPGAGWKQMNDRGSVTANHYDHPHVSVF